MSYSFENNLKRLSQSPIDYKKEWSQEEIVTNDTQTSENRCICNRPIKIAHVCRNEINGNVVKMGSSCVKKILGLDEDTGKAKELAKKNNIRLFEKGVYIDITDLSKYVLDVLRDYMRRSSIQDIKRWMDMYKTNPIMLAVIESVYKEKHQQILAQQSAQQKQVAKKEAGPRQLPRGPPPAMTFLTAEMRYKYGSYDKYAEIQREVY